MTHAENEGGEIARYVFFSAMIVIFITRINHQKKFNRLYLHISFTIFKN